MQLEDFIQPSAIKELTAPTGEALGLPGNIYGDGFYELEKRELFPKLWAAVAVGAQLPQAGDLLPVELAGRPLLLVRGKDETIRCFHNICRHRAMRLVDAPCRTGARITCPWHAFSYDLEGQLMATPNIGGFGINEAETFDRSALGLKPVRCETWLDIVFVNLDGKAPPLDEHLAAYRDTIAQYELGGLEHSVSLGTTYPANWKVFFEGALEDYHLPWGHPEIMDGVLAYETICRSDGRSYSAIRGAQVHAPEEAQQNSHKSAPAEESVNSRFPTLPHADRLPWGDFTSTIVPTALVVISPDEFVIILGLPESGEATRLDLHVYVLGEAAGGPNYAGQCERRRRYWRAILEQDERYVTGVQQAAARRDAAGIRIRFSPYWEQSVQDFQRIVINTIQDGGTAQ